MADGQKKEDKKEVEDKSDSEDGSKSVPESSLPSLGNSNTTTPTNPTFPLTPTLSAGFDSLPHPNPPSNTPPVAPFRFQIITQDSFPATGFEAVLQA
jgi:hypothetical protein